MNIIFLLVLNYKNILTRTHPSHLESPYLEDSIGSNNSTEAVIIAQDAISIGQLQLPVQNFTRTDVNSILDKIRLSLPVKTLAELRQ